MARFMALFASRPESADALVRKQKHHRAILTFHMVCLELFDNGLKCSALKTLDTSQQEILTP